MHLWIFKYDIEILIGKLHNKIGKLTNKNKNVIIVGDLNIDFLNGNANAKLQTMLNSTGCDRVVNGTSCTTGQIT